MRVISDLNKYTSYNPGYVKTDGCTINIINNICVFPLHVTSPAQPSASGGRWRDFGGAGGLFFEPPWEGGQVWWLYK